MNEQAKTNNFISRVMSRFASSSNFLKSIVSLITGFLFVAAGYFYIEDLLDFSDIGAPNGLAEYGIQADEGDGNVSTGTYNGYADYDDTCDCIPKISVTVTKTSWNGDVWNEEWNIQMPYSLYGSVEGPNLFDQYGNHVGRVENDQLVIDFYGGTQYLSK